MDKSINQIKTIFWTLFGLITVMLLMAVFTIKNTGPLMDWNLTQRENLKSVILILSLGGIPASYFFHSKKIKHLRPDLPLQMKIKHYKISFLIKIITLEALSVLGILSYMLTSDNTFLYVFSLLFLAYLINRPTKHGIIEELEANSPDKANES
jgi:hypothetical protein